MVVFSHDIFGAQRAGGISRCMLELMRALGAIGAPWTLWFGPHENEHLSAALNEAWTGGHVTSLPHQARARWFGARLSVEPAFARAVRRTDALVVHRTYYPVVDLTERARPRVETLHDMWDERAGPHANRSTWAKSLVKRRALERADQIICVSESTRRELISVWPWAEARATVVPHGVRRLAMTAIPSERQRPYFLFVGRRDLYKNFAVALKALRLSNLHDHELICFGGGALAPGELSLINELRLASRVHQLGGSDARLAGLYEGATALVYPSYYEGFGLPLLEAMIHGCPVVASPLTSLPEVGGDAAIYAPPDDAEAWAQIMVALATSASLVDHHRHLGFERAAKFSWERTAQAHRSIYQKFS